MNSKYELFHKIHLRAKHSTYPSALEHYWYEYGTKYLDWFEEFTDQYGHKDFLAVQDAKPLHIKEREVDFIIRV